MNILGISINSEFGIWLLFNLLISLVPFFLKYVIGSLFATSSPNIDEIFGITKGELLLLCIAINADTLGSVITATVEQEINYIYVGVFLILILVESAVFGALSLFSSATTTPLISPNSKFIRKFTLIIIGISLSLSLYSKVQFASASRSQDQPAPQQTKTTPQNSKISITALN